ncbi:MAG: hypothetical protein IJL32_01110 [Oscillospiraceae bacterium]|nr:hypothetical protein [Oscillospiraceae bacterium]
MKKVIYICLLCVATLSLCSCEGGSSSEAQSESTTQSESTNLVESTEKTGAVITDSTTVPMTSDIVAETEANVIPEPEKEYVETYYIYAEKGAVITKMDSKTGEFSWKGKCESCGTVSNTEHVGERLTLSVSKKTTSFVCSNSKCDLWGKGQPVVIGCDVTGEWVEVN